jgi:hypothetical protein
MTMSPTSASSERDSRRGPPGTGKALGAAFPSDLFHYNWPLTQLPSKFPICGSNRFSVLR